MTSILNDPVGRRALDHLLINDQTVHDNPELKRSFAAYITPDGHRARIDLTQANRMFSHDAMDQVVDLPPPAKRLSRRIPGRQGDGQGRRRQCRVGRCPGAHPQRPGPELVHRADRRFHRLDRGAA